jgi:hypothetical protein
MIEQEFREMAIDEYAYINVREAGENTLVEG